MFLIFVDLKVAVVQMKVTATKRDNICTAERLIREAVKKHNPKVVVLPESFTCPHGNRRLIEADAEKIPTGETATLMSKLASELKVVLVCGTIPEKDDTKNKLTNTTMVYDTTGKLIAKHKQMHLANIDITKDKLPERMEHRDDIKLLETEIMEAGSKLTMIDVDGVKIGLGACSDLSHPEMATLYRQHGCDVMIYVTAMPACLGHLKFEVLNRARAMDNQIAVIGAAPARDRAGKDCMETNGKSVVCDAWGRVIARAGDGEEVLAAEIGKILK